MVIVLLLLLPLVTSASEADKISDENLARVWLDEFNTQAEDVYYKTVEAAWNFETNATEHNHRNRVSLV